MYRLFLCFSLWIGLSFHSIAKQVSVLETGAKGDGKTIDTKAIQKAIDLVSAEGGGKVILPAGRTYLSGSLLLCSNLVFEIEAGATLKGSPNRADYIPFERELFHFERLKNHPLGWNRHHLINIRGVHHVQVCGLGIIDGNGDAFWKPYTSAELPKWIEAEVDRVSNMVEVYRSSDISFRDITLTHSPEWTLHLYACNRVLVQGITIDNGLYGPNNDGIDITGSKGVRISDCHITSCDDAICLKTGTKSGPCEEITVTNCVIKTLCVALKIGNETYDDIRNVVFSNCVVTGSSRIIGIYAEEGGTIENIQFSHITGNTNAPLVLNRPIHIALVQLPYDFIDATRPKQISQIRNINIDHFDCVTDGRIMITSIEGGKIDGLSMDHIHLSYPLIDDPTPIASSATSAQFRLLSESDKIAPAAIVMTRVTNAKIQNLQIDWPTNLLPNAWVKFDRKIENGSSRTHKRNYEVLRETEFKVLQGTELYNGTIDLRGVQASNPQKQPLYKLEKSTIAVLK